MTNGLTRGWKMRRTKAEQRRAEADELVADARAQRAAMYEAERARSAAAAAEAAERQKLARVSCPCCDGAGPIDIALAERVIRAMAFLPAHIAVNDSVILALQNIAHGRDVDRRVIYPNESQLHVPHRVYAAAPAADPVADPVADTRAAITPKTEPLIPAKPRRKPTAAEIYAAGDDGVAELDD